MYVKSSGKTAAVLLTCLLLLNVFAAAGQARTHRWGEILFHSNQTPQLAHFQSLTEHLNSLEIAALSPEFSIYTLRFDPGHIHEVELLRAVKALPAVQAAQFNYFLMGRNVPNDPFFSQQWPLLNIGQMNGLPDADTDADLAWDIGTGGLSMQGDTIVLCIIDSGFDPFHPDLRPNFWHNFNEIPNNGLDDDGNGYTDDFNGWNVIDQSDDIQNIGPDAWHGTPVMGVAAAAGNNGIGMAGVNWQLKVMPVIHGNSIAEVVQAYAYPYKMRKLYNTSAGQQGSLVVVTNASWGINYGQPTDAPLWCAIFDSLGQAGILNVAATANLDIDVDQAGDLPTSCPSEFLISVTATDQHDSKSSSAAFGTTHIDIGAPGREVFSTLEQQQYGFLSGTSLAAPYVSGSIALLYSAPCPSLLRQARSDPVSAAQNCRQYILNGSDAIPDLQNMVAENRRLNIFKSMRALLDSCNYSDCLDPFNIQFHGIEMNQIDISWDIGLSGTTTNLRFRPLGQTNWELRKQIANPYQLLGLSACQEYEIQLQSICDTLNNAWTRSFVIRTEGCCEAASPLQFQLITEDAIYVSWPKVAVANGYHFRYRLVGMTGWQQESTTTTNIFVEGLSTCSEYEYQLGVSCLGDTAAHFGAIGQFATYGCSNCLELDYCQASGPTTNNSSWISRFQLAEIDHSSANDYNGYSDFTSHSATLVRGLNYPIQIHTNTQGGFVYPIFTVWIDYNQDSDFDDPNELVFTQVADTSKAAGALLLPPDVPLGSTRLRVSARDASYSPCGTSGILGEVEDYCIDMVDEAACVPPQAIHRIVLGNTVQFSWQRHLQADAYRLRYKAVANSQWSYLDTSFPFLEISMLNDCTDYEYAVQSICQGEESAVSAVGYFTTSGCGSCIDFQYCAAKANSTFEWINRISLAGEMYESGNDKGYLKQTEKVFHLQKNECYPFEIVPNWANTSSEAYYVAWLDFNQDGLLEDPEERVFDSQKATDELAVSGKIFIPANAHSGSSLLRIAMKQALSPASSCDQGYFGEIEDHCVHLSDDSTSERCAADFALQWQAGSTSLVFDWQASPPPVAYSLRYAPSHQFPRAWTELQMAFGSCYLGGLEACQEYEIQLRAICDAGPGSYQQSWQVETECLTGKESRRVVPQLYFYPNPFHNYLVIANIPAINKRLGIKIYDVSGKLIRQQQLPKPVSDPLQIQFDRPLVAGTYLAVIQLDEQRVSKKLVVY